MVALVRGRHPSGEPSGASSSGVDERYTWADSNGDSPRPCARVVACGVEQAREQQRTHQALVLAERILKREHALLAGQAESIDGVRRDERVGDALVEAAVAQQVLETPAQALARGEPPDRRAARRQRGRRLWSPWIRATSSIRSASRCTSLSRQGGTTQPPSPRSNPSRSRISSTLSGAISRPSSLEIRSWRSGRRGRRLRVYVHRPRHHARAAQVDHQPCRQPLGRDRLLGVQLLLEASRRLGAQPQRLRGPHDVRPDPGGRLHQHARGRLRDLGDLPAHDPGDAARAIRVADERHLGREGTLGVVERDHALALGRAADVDAPAAHLVEVEGVQRLRLVSIT